MTSKAAGEDDTWGSCDVSKVGTITWDGMIGFLDGRGLPFGGVVRFKNDTGPQATLDSAQATATAAEARVFVLRFSPNANTDGLAYKALELVEAIRLVLKVTGAEKVRLVGHSAGGLVARVYLQSALPGVKYRGDVDRLITIGTPHLGSALAAHFGDFLGTRATSLMPKAALVHDLNNVLELPAETTFASIVVRGIAADARGEGHELDELVDKEYLARLPVEYQRGGDQVVHVRSQNLRLARTAARYEAKTGRPIHYVLARVLDPAPRDWTWIQETVHGVSRHSAMVQHLVLGLLSDQTPFWSKSNKKELAAWIECQARLHALGAIEADTYKSHPISQIDKAELKEFRLVRHDEDLRVYAFKGRAFSKSRGVPLHRRWTDAEGTLELTFDPFGRVLCARAKLD
jgi:pimeloyl-ACP methyl ester carboxylesterase